MRIVMITTLYPPIVVGGAEKATQLLAEAFARNGDEIVIISLYPGKSEVVEEQGNVRIYRLPLDNLYWPFGTECRPHRVAKVLWHLRDIWNRKAARRVRRILDIEKPDVVHTHNLSGLSVSVWKEVKVRNIRLIHTVHDYYLLCPRSSLFRGGRSCIAQCLSCRAFSVVSKSCQYKPDAVIAVSESVLNTHRLYGHCRNLAASVIHNIEDSHEQPGNPLPPVTRLHSDDLIFGFIGKVSEAKGYPCC